MVRDLTDILRSSATNRRGPMWPVWNGDEAEWAFDSCLLGHYRYVSFPGVTVPRPKLRQETARSCRPSRSSAPTRQQPDQRPASSGAPQHEPPEMCAGFLSTRPRRRRSAGTGIDVDKVPAAINAVGAAQIARTGSLNIADALQQQVPGIIISDTTGNPFMPDIQFRGFDGVAGRRYSAGTGGLPERHAHQRSVRRHRQLGPDPDRCDQVGHRRDQQPRVRSQRAGRSRQRADEGWLQLSGRRNQHDGRLVRTHPEFGAVWQADRQLVGLRRARRRARQRISQFFGIGDPALLWRCRLPDR